MLNEAESRAKWEIQFDYWFGCIKSPGRLTLTTATSVKRWRWKPDCDGHSVSEKRSSEKWSRRCRHKAPNMFIKRTKMWGRNWIGALGQANLLFFVDLGLKRLGFFKWRKGALTWKKRNKNIYPASSWGQYRRKQSLIEKVMGGMSCPQGTESFCCHMQLKGTLREEAESAEDSASDRTWASEGTGKGTGRLDNREVKLWVIRWWAKLTEYLRGTSLEVQKLGLCISTKMGWISNRGWIPG